MRMCGWECYDFEIESRQWASWESWKVPENGKDQGAKTKHGESRAANSNIHHLHTDPYNICNICKVLQGTYKGLQEATIGYNDYKDTIITRVCKGLQSTRGFKRLHTRQSEVVVVHNTRWSALLTNTARRGWRMNRANASFVLSRENSVSTSKGGGCLPSDMFSESSSLITHRL